MPIATIQTPDGKAIKIDVPEGATHEQILSFVQSQDLASIEKKDPSSAGDIAIGALETAATIGTGIIAEPISGIAGIVQASNPFASEGAGARAVEGVRDFLTFQPRTEQGRQALQATGEVLQPIGKAISAVETTLGDVAFDLTGSPAVAAAAVSTPTLALELIGLKGLKGIRKGTRLVDDTGRPTKALSKALERQGLDFDNLAPQSKELIPVRADPNLIPGGEVAGQAEKALAAQIKSGARDDALAGLMVVRDQVKADKLGVDAVKQGFRPGFVQSVKTATPATKSKMREMTKTMRRIKKQERLGLDMRPSDVIGSSVTDRMMFVRNKANKARKELDAIARGGSRRPGLVNGGLAIEKQGLKGKKIDAESVLSTLERSLDDLDVRLVDTPSGVPRAEFSGSLISKDRSSQRVIRDLVDLMSEGGVPDALRAHKLKRQLDIMIDFNKKSAAGLSEAGKGVLKDIRRSLNDSIRAVDKDYARVNDVLSESLGTLGAFDDAVGSIDIFGKGAEKAIGTKMRSLLSNQQGRVRLENSLDQLEETTKNLKGRFSDDIKDLVMFADGLDDRFGTIARTSLSGQVEQGTKQAARELGRVGARPGETAFEFGAQVAGSGLEKLRGINDFNAFRAIDDILSR
jgi:hypothetical protein